MAELIDELARIKSAKPKRKVVVLTSQETSVIEREINQKMKLVVREFKKMEITSRLIAEKTYLGGGICC